VVDWAKVATNLHRLTGFRRLPAAGRLLRPHQESDNLLLLAGAAETSKTTKRHRDGRHADN